MPKRSSLGPFETRTFGSGFQMVRISDGRDRPKSTIRKPNQSGFWMYTVYYEFFLKCLLDKFFINGQMNFLTLSLSVNFYRIEPRFGRNVFALYTKELRNEMNTSNIDSTGERKTTNFAMTNFCNQLSFFSFRSKFN
jgi:hypothetical protein